MLSCVAHMGIQRPFFLMHLVYEWCCIYICGVACGSLLYAFDIHDIFPFRFMFPL